MRSADVPLPANPWKVLFVEGFSECGVEFHLHSLLKQPWPTQERYLYAWNRDQPAEFAKVRLALEPAGRACSTKGEPWALLQAVLHLPLLLARQCCSTC